MTQPPAAPPPSDESEAAEEEVPADSAGVYLDLDPDAMGYGNLEKVKGGGSRQPSDER